MKRALIGASLGLFGLLLIGIAIVASTPHNKTTPREPYHRTVTDRMPVPQSLPQDPPPAPTHPTAPAPTHSLPTSTERPLQQVQQPTPTPTTSSPAPQHTSSPDAWGCAAALAYWQLHGNKRFHFICTGNTSVRPEAWTCPTVCTGGSSWTVQINDPCPVAYMNEASNSWTWNTYNGGLGWYSYEVSIGQNVPWSVQHAHGLDPYGYSC